MPFCVLNQFLLHLCEVERVEFACALKRVLLAAGRTNLVFFFRSDKNGTCKFFHTDVKHDFRFFFTTQVVAIYSVQGEEAPLYLSPHPIGFFVNNSVL